jgi:hypothetical protein
MFGILAFNVLYNIFYFFKLFLILKQYIYIYIYINFKKFKI